MKPRITPTFAVFLVATALTVTLVAGSAESNSSGFQGHAALFDASDHSASVAAEEREALYMLRGMDKASSRLIISKY